MRGTRGRTASDVTVAKKGVKHEGAVYVKSVAGRRREVMLLAQALNSGGIHLEVQFAAKWELRKMRVSILVDISRRHAHILSECIKSKTRQFKKSATDACVASAGAFDPEPRARHPISAATHPNGCFGGSNMFVSRVFPMRRERRKNTPTFSGKIRLLSLFMIDL